MSIREQDSDEYYYKSSVTIQHYSFSICTLDLYGTVLAYFERIRIKASTQVPAGYKSATYSGCLQNNLHLYRKQDKQLMLPLADVMQDILQVLVYTRYEMRPTAVADNANVIFLCQ
ncbi:hypothetical protein Tco_1451884 [Tanacetum coccineum]